MSINITKMIVINIYIISNIIKIIIKTIIINIYNMKKKTVFLRL